MAVLITPKRVRALFDFVGSQADELTFRKGDVIEVKAKNEEWYVGTFQGREGIFPANHVEDIGGATPSAAAAGPSYSTAPATSARPQSTYVPRTLSMA